MLSEMIALFSFVLGFSLGYLLHALLFGEASRRS